MYGVGAAHLHSLVLILTCVQLSLGRMTNIVCVNSEQIGESKCTLQSCTVWAETTEIDTLE